MPLQPVYANGKVRLYQVEAGDTAREEYLKAQENDRRLAITKRRLYYDGEQYEAENLEAQAAYSSVASGAKRLPEHLRRHAYSTQVQESVDFLADQMAAEFAVVAEATEVQTVVDSVFAATPDLSGTGDDEDVSVTDVLRDAMIAGDTPVLIKWDPVDETCWWEFWESEAVRFDYDPLNKTKLERVSMEEVVWVDSVDGEKQVVARYVWEVVDGECVKRTYHDDNDDVVEQEQLGIPFIPWGILRAMKKTIRATRGESVITDQACQSADRYNAVEQVAWLIARYNSHGNLAVIGDAATLKAQADERIEKDVADVLTFPGGTALSAITLPTDPAMILHQREVLLDSLYGSFGLARVDTVTVAAFGQLSGYALEILNRKTEGTFTRVRQRYTADLKTLLSLTLDMTAWSAGTDEDSEFDEGRVDPASTYPTRNMEVRMGSAYVVDDVLVRDDYVAQLISRREALRQRGMSEADIDRIEQEVEAEEPAEPEVGTFSTNKTGAGSTLSP